MKIIPQGQQVAQHTKHPLGTTDGTPPRWHALALPDRCPRCNDTLALYHVRGDSRHHPGNRSHHFLGCHSCPHCSYTVDYDALLHELLQRLSERLVRCEAQIAWQLIQLEALREGVL
jgi:ssDNA-binding Zn-finger/Zn-ribbon topoisomerase 1